MVARSTDIENTKQEELHSDVAHDMVADTFSTTSVKVFTKKRIENVSHTVVCDAILSRQDFNEYAPAILFFQGKLCTFSENRIAHALNIRFSYT